jgi:hypothetical protein
MCVAMKPRRNEEAQAHIRLSSHTKKKEFMFYFWIISTDQDATVPLLTYGVSFIAVLSTVMVTGFTGGCVVLSDNIFRYIIVNTLHKGHN